MIYFMVFLCVQSTHYPLFCAWRTCAVLSDIQFGYDLCHLDFKWCPFVFFLNYLAICCEPNIHSETIATEVLSHITPCVLPEVTASLCVCNTCLFHNKMFDNEAAVILVIAWLKKNVMIILTLQMFQLEFARDFWKYLTTNMRTRVWVKLVQSATNHFKNLFS